VSTTLIKQTLKPVAIVLSIAAISQSALADAGGGNTLGGMATRVSTDSLQWGSLFTTIAYLLASCLVIAGLFAIYSHTRNPNGQWKTHHGAVALLVAGGLFAWNLIGGFGSQTVAGAAATATGANSQVLTIQ